MATETRMSVSIPDSLLEKIIEYKKTDDNCMKPISKVLQELIACGIQAKKSESA